MRFPLCHGGKVTFSRTPCSQHARLPETRTTRSRLLRFSSPRDARDGNYPRRCRLTHSSKKSNVCQTRKNETTGRHWPTSLEPHHHRRHAKWSRPQKLQLQPLKRRRCPNRFNPLSRNGRRLPKRSLRQNRFANPNRWRLHLPLHCRLLRLLQLRRRLATGENWPACWGYRQRRSWKSPWRRRHLLLRSPPCRRLRRSPCHRRRNRAWNRVLKPVKKRSPRRVADFVVTLGEEIVTADEREGAVAVIFGEHRRKRHPKEHSRTSRRTKIAQR